MKINMTEWAKAVIDSKKVVAVPVMTHPGIEMIGRRVIDAVSDGEVHFNAVRALAGRYDTAAATVIMDLTVEAEAFGADIAFEPDEVPAVRGHMLNSADDIARLQVPSLSAGRVPAYLKANLLAARAITDRPVLAGCIGPFSLAGRLFGMSELMMALFTAPDAVCRLLEKCTQFIETYCRALRDTGAQGVIMAEPAAGLISNDDCLRYVTPYIRRIVESVQDDRFLVILHNCGDTGHCTEAMVGTGAAGYHFGNQADMVAALDACPGEALVMGNLDPVGIFKGASPEEVYRATRDLLETTRRYPNYVISSGCDVPPAVPAANIEAFYRAVTDYNATLTF